MSYIHLSYTQSTEYSIFWQKPFQVSSLDSDFHLSISVRKNWLKISQLLSIKTKVFLKFGLSLDYLAPTENTANIRNILHVINFSFVFDNNKQKVSNNRK